MAEKTLNFFRYLLGKSSDIQDLNRNDVLLGKIVLDIHRKRRETAPAWLPLDQILPIHPIDREEARETMLRRAAAVAENRDHINAQGKVSREFLHQFLPSVSDIKVVDLGEGQFVSFEGNGRLAALKEGLDKGATLPVEVERYSLDAKDRKRLRRRIDKVRRRNGLGPLPPNGSE